MHTYWTQNFNLLLFIEFPTRSARDTWGSVWKIPWYEAATRGAISTQWKPQGRLPTNKSADLSITKRCKGVIKLYTVINCAEPIFHSTFGSLNQLPPGRPSFERKLNESLTVVYYTECNHPMCARHQSPSCSATGNEEILDRPGQTVRHTMIDL